MKKLSTKYAYVLEGATEEQLKQVVEQLKEYGSRWKSLDPEGILMYDGMIQEWYIEYHSVALITELF